MNRQYKLLHDIEEAFDQVVEASGELVEICRAHPGEAWALDAPRPDADWLASALLDFWYIDGQDGRTTRPYVGLMAASEPVMEAVGRVNAAKHTFADTLAAIKDEDQRMIAELKASLPYRHPYLHDHMKGSGLARLHLKQCWRHIPAAEQPLQRVRLAWYTSGRSIRRVTIREAEQMLIGLGAEQPHVQIQLRALAGLPSSEPLAQVQHQAPLMRVNLFYEEPLRDGRIRRAMNLALPLFIPSENGKLPHHNQPPPFPPEERTRKVRSDERLEQEPFLRSLRIYRYKGVAA
ncbi:DNA replication terminus site-binding protein [Halomonas sp. LBP4]|uniref:DNA replication terminus site-binding protein n=1 Tax=Halomonas sp. LBP4 TaxID=2044917 RepID=UPI000D77238D|nr:DNA replication terminus site-binding protein [Halomonas sp. LBP4]PXX95903.1 DNA replication terminus site-binding protein [Halomonas sp. LBP4]